MRNFYLQPEKWQEPYTIDGQEAKHIAKVLRLGPGEHLQLFDGQGRSGEFGISQVSSGKVVCKALDIIETPRPAGRCWLAPAYTKAARRSFLLEKSVELEAGGIWFWQADFSQAKVPQDSKEKWQAELVAGAKQSGNRWLPELRTFAKGAEELAQAGSAFGRRFLLWEDAGQGKMLLPDDLQPQTAAFNPNASKEELKSRTETETGPLNLAGDALFIMGPEGGLSKQEVEVFIRHGFKPVSLGRRILRWETAAVLCLGLSWWMNEINLSLNGKE